MSKAAIKTNNDDRFLQAKINLRFNSLPDKEAINILECNGGEGVLWNAVKKLTDKKLNILSIDKNKYNKIQLQGDNIKFLKTLNLAKFDIIDIDAYGSPVDQLEVLFHKNYRGTVHCTFITQHLAGIKKQILRSANIPSEMMKCKTIWKSKSERLFFNYLYNQGITGITGITGKKTTGMTKNYFYFVL